MDRNAVSEDACRENVKFSVQLPGIKRTYKIMHITDVHVSTAFPDEPEFFRKEAELRGGEYFPPHRGYSAAQRFPLYFEKAVELGLDCVLMTGDIIDFASRSNLELLSGTVRNAGIRTVYCLGNHDWSSMYDYHSAAFAAALNDNFLDVVNAENEESGDKSVCGGQQAYGLPASAHYRAEDMGEFIIFAVDNTLDRIDREALEAARVVFSKDKPVLVACHIPFWSETLEEPTRNYWGSVLLIGERGLVPDEATSEFVSLMTAQKSPVFAIAAGHIHFTHEDIVAGRIPQFVTEEGHAGEYGIIEIRP
ncbi:MAG: metallophosphoesterase [Clostridia bacterium]|nr:metallophosphoesterase [Clostridia bacterium]